MSYVFEIKKEKRLFPANTPFLLLEKLRQEGYDVEFDGDSDVWIVNNPAIVDIQPLANIKVIG